jgi:hypothetical protein
MRTLQEERQKLQKDDRLQALLRATEDKIDEVTAIAPIAPFLSYQAL